jgi:F-type H+-transporting ATPase subunit delta
MTLHTVARRYAQALFDVTQAGASQAPAQTDAITAALIDLARLIASHSELQSLIASPTVPPAAKKSIIMAVLDQAGVTIGEVRRLVGLLADQDRLSILDQVAEAFAERVRESRKVAYADVVTAVPLTPATRAALEEALGRASGKTVTLSERVDPSIIGGVVARIGSFVYDRSIAHQLDKLRKQLTANQ